MKYKTLSNRILAIAGLIGISLDVVSCIGGGCPPDEEVIIEFADNSGRDLFNESTPNHFNKIDVKVFTLINREKKLLFDGHSASPGYLFPDPYNNFQPLTIPVASKIILLQLSPSITDTIYVVNKLSKCPTVIDSVRYNKVLVHTFNSISLKAKPIKIVK